MHFCHSGSLNQQSVFLHFIIGICLLQFIINVGKSYSTWNVLIICTLNKTIINLGE